ncbi:SMI1/KNR4 family protein [Shimia sp. Alg240-R146]|uniref:SMI1/KNR4 family protein n=1 Tax=Shimia sp. Alg240-R146 TaxID=2993449 RepID=UPI0022E2E4FF|nr:SMI1/KNR4 family protein [Shimia sp. Alg240-R146]
MEAYEMPWPVDEKFIEACEATLGVKLPSEYRKSLKTENGGEVVCDGDNWDLHPVWDKSDKKRLKRTAMDIVRETAALKDWVGWPDNAICIGANGMGDALAFLYESGVCTPSVYRWQHETGEIAMVARDFGRLTRSE